VESPVIYPHGKKQREGQIPDNDVVKLARLAGELAGRYRASVDLREYVLPRTWKGTVPKSITERRVLEVLDARETQLLYSTKSARARSLDSNVVDAVGIGLWRLGRKYRGEAK
jgi:hypothetical protein